MALTPALSKQKPRILVLGGTRFLGRALAQEALARGYDLTLFHRGQSDPHLFPEAEHILGDRNLSSDALRHRQFDLVLDSSGQLPRQVELSTAALPDVPYVFFSSISVYADFSTAGVDESSPLTSPEGVDLREERPANYAARKVACEKPVLRRTQGLVIRPGLIVGPYDPTDRFTYWVMRGRSKNPRLLAPGTPADPVQWIDVRDLASWAITLGLSGASGAYNAVGPAQRTTIRELLAVCAPDKELIWVEAKRLESLGVAPWSDMPCWVPPESSGFCSVNNRKALDAGLTFRPLKDTVADTLRWRQTVDSPLKSGLSEEREQSLLARLARAERPAFKGKEVYSWQEKGQRVFVVMDGTNRRKSWQEVRACPARLSLEQLEAALGDMAIGETVVWQLSAQDCPPGVLERPCAATLSRLRKLASELKISLLVPD